MEQDTLKMLLQQSREDLNCPGRTSAGRELSRCRRVIGAHAEQLYHLSRRGGALNDEEIWLCDNAFLLSALFRRARPALGAIPRGARRLAYRVMAAAEDALEEKDLETLFSFCRMANAEEEVYEALVPAFILACARVLAERCEAGGDPLFSPCIRTLRFLSGVDVTRYIGAFSPLEEILKKDPSQAYGRMPPAFRRRLRTLLLRRARRHGIEPRALAEKECARARKTGEWIGAGLEKQGHAGLCYTALVTLSSLLLGGLFSVLLLREYPFSAAAFAAFLLVGQSAGAVCISFFDAVFSKLVPGKPLWRVRFERIPEECAALTVYTALLAEPEEIRQVCRRLEEAFFASFVPARGEEHLYFALLLDLPAAAGKETERDRELYSSAEEEIRELNKKYGDHFVLYTRPRVPDGEGMWSGRERKRGALLSLSAYLCGRESEIVPRVGRALSGKIKYVLTLDSDTRISPGAVQEMIGILEHPANRARVETKRGVKVVTHGHAILQPRMEPTAGSAGKSPFTVLESGCGGTPAYASAAFDRAQTLFSRGSFCGKGMFLLSAFDEVLTGAFPDHTVLSHDLLEGARLGCAAVTDLVFLDEIPSTPRAFAERAHRWCRGDLQALFFSGWRARGQDGKKHYNPIPFFYRTLLWDNLRRALLPAASVLLLFFSLFLTRPAGRVLILAALLPYLLPAAVDEGYLLVSSRLKGLIHKFVSPVESGVWQRLFSLGFTLSGLSYEAWRNLDALLRALWRMEVSHKKRLEWKTASASEGIGKGDGVWAYVSARFVSVLAGAFLLAFSASSPVRFLGFLWILHPVLCALIAKPFPKEKHLVKKPARELMARYVRDLSRFFTEEVGPWTHDLPPDHYTDAPVKIRAMRTSPTNIGLYLASLCAMTDFGILEVQEALRRIEACIATVEKLPRWHTLLYNWYDLETLEVLGERYVSSVDCGNFLACLAALIGFLKEEEEAGEDVGKLKARVTALYRGMSLKPLYRQDTHLFSVGYDESRGRQDSASYDFYMSEARLTSYLAIARGEVPAEHWGRLSRPLITRGGYLGAASFSGTAFEFFMPLLFFPLPYASFEKEALTFAAACQRRAGVQTPLGEVFGVSESAYYAVEANGDYPYRANGIAPLAMRQDVMGQNVISPYSSFLMLPLLPHAAAENLKKLEALGVYGKYGFCEAAEFSRSGADVVQSFFAHHTGMAIVAAANFVFDGVFCRRFLSCPEMGAMTSLLSEKIPVNAAACHRSGEKRGYPVLAEARERPRGFEVIPGKASALIVPSAGATLLLDSTGHINVIYRTPAPVLLCRPPEKEAVCDGFVVRARVNGVVYSSVPAENPPSCRLFASPHPGGILITLRHRDLRIRFVFSLSGKTGALAVETQLYGAVGQAEVFLSFAALLKPAEEYRAHPAFCTLSLTAEKRPSALTVSCRRSGGGETVMALCDETEGSVGVPAALWGQELEDLGGAAGALSGGFFPPSVSGAVSSPRFVLKRTLFSPSYRTHLNHRFCIGFEKSVRAATANARYLAALNREEMREEARLSASFAERAMLASGLDNPFSAFCRTLTHRLLFARSPRKRAPFSEQFRREELYRFGISGDLPIVLCPVTGGEEGELYRLLASLKRFHAICGFDYDLVFFSEGEGYLHKGTHAALFAVRAAGAEYLLGVRGGIFLVEGEPRDRALFSAAAFLELSSLASLGEEERAQAPGPERPPLPKSDPTDGFGTFSGDSFFLDKTRCDPAENFSHILASPTFGALVTHRSLGYTFETSSRFRRLTRVESDPYLASFGEKLLLTDMQSGKTWDLAAESRLVEFSPGYARYSGEVGSAAYTVTVFCHPTRLFRGVEAELSGTGDYTLSYAVSPVLGDEVGALGAFSAAAEGNLLVISRALTPLSRPLDAYLFLYGGDARETGAFSLGTRLTLNGKRKIAFYLGAKTGEKQFSSVKEYLFSHSFAEMFSFSVSAARAVLPPPAVPADGGDRARFLNGWLGYQVIASRLFARCGFSQPGGAWGFRDQLQDALFFLGFAPEKSKNIILRHAAHQFSEGDVLHWWHNLADERGAHRGVRTRIGDDYLWLVYAAERYAEKTGDIGFLSREVPFLTGAVLSSGERDRYEAYPFGEKAPMAEHLVRAAELFCSRGVGAHGLARMLSGDWNDGFSAFGEGAESVFLSQFGALVLRRLCRLLRRAGLDEDLLGGYEAFARKLEAACAHTFVPACGWFARAYFGDGEALGADETLSSPCAIDLLPQAFSAFCYLEKPEEERTEEEKARVLSALTSAEKHLFDRRGGVVRLFYPPFEARGREVGYIRTYSSGVRENGGQYTHAAIWFCFACREMAPHTDEPEKWRALADEVAESLLPYRAASDGEFARRYRLEPYALCGDVWASPGREGRAGWNWYTGSAAWLWRYFADENDTF